MRTFSYVLIRRNVRHLLGTLSLAVIFALLVTGSMPWITTAEKQDDLPQATQTVFSNSSPITINDAATATPYPSSIVVSGLGNYMPSTPGSVKVTLNNFSHTFPDDVGIVLFGPTGGALLLQDGAGAEPDMIGVTYTISDTGSTVLPDLTAWTAGTYKPTSYYDGDGFPAPGPGTAFANPGPAGGVTATFSSVFGGTNPNGTWSLFVVDFATGHTGSI
jgi:subtilisin-like proprotein convertase family protein